MPKKNTVSAQALAQAPDFSSQMDSLVKKAMCDATNRDDSGGFSATVVHRDGYTLSATVSYDQQTASGWQSAMDGVAQQILAQLQNDMGAGRRESDPGNGPIESGTIKVEGSK